MFSKILVPLDGTPEAETALAPAAAIAEKFESSVCLIQVTPGYGSIIGATAAESFGSAGSVAAAAEVAQAAEQSASAYLDTVRQQYGGGTWQTVLAEGDSADAIVDQSRAVGADLIVMATHGRTGLKRLFIGSVADDVIKKCGIPVLVVHSLEDPKD